MALTWLRLSPVFTTRSGSSSASEDSHCGFPVLARDEMDVAQVQDPERTKTRRKDGQGFLAEDELVLFPQPVTRGGRNCGGTGRRSYGKAAPDAADAACQGPCVSHWRYPLPLPLLLVGSGEGVDGACAGEELCVDGVVWRVGVPLIMFVGGAGNGLVPYAGAICAM